ncbi:DUF4064 domain-containing protein [Alkalibacterium iburiense]|jgi:hypothetical protein|uniref:DUF4064 domain-containing protein n=1 Tax=Alkalibacterium iburiense TaxID=290589 RepID=A0ABN0X7F8_9LACT
MIRKAETIIGIIGGVLSLIFFGAFSVTIMSTDFETFEETLYPSLPNYETFTSSEQAYELMTEFSTWMGIFLFLMVIVLVFATLFIYRNGRPKIAGILYIVTGVLLLIGTQGIGFPFAFLFFVSAGLSFFRKIEGDKNDI